MYEENKGFTEPIKKEKAKQLQIAERITIPISYEFTNFTNMKRFHLA